MYWCIDFIAPNHHSHNLFNPKTCYHQGKKFSAYKVMDFACDTHPYDETSLPRCHLCLPPRRWCLTPSINNGNANKHKVCSNNLRTKSSLKEYWNQINQSKGLQIYWHQSEGIRPPFNRVDSVLLELPYDGLTDWFFASMWMPTFCCLPTEAKTTFNCFWICYYCCCYYQSKEKAYQPMMNTVYVYSE